MNNYIKITGAISLSVMLLSCGSGTDSFEKKAAVDSSALKPVQVQISEQTLNDLLQSIPSPIEMSSLLKESGAKFDNTIINPSEHVDKYLTGYSKALNIGVYSADLGYLNIYEKSFATLDYLSSIKNLADGINIGQFFDFELLKKLASNNNNMDSILYISTSNFNKMDSYLREKKRGELSVLIISGAWIEGLYISTQIAKSKDTPEIEERIGEQKLTIDNLMVILDAYKGTEYFGKLHTQFEKLKTIYDTVKIEYEYHEPESKEVNGKLVVVNQSKSKVIMTTEQLKSIISTTSEIRNQLISE